MDQSKIIDTFDTYQATTYPLHKGKHHVFNYTNKAHDHNQDHIMGERDNHIVTGTSLSPNEGLLPPHHGKQRC